MPTYGLTFDGFVSKTIDIIREELNAALREAFGNSIDLGDRSVFGHIVGIIAERLAQLWELAEAVNASQDPDKATGAALDALCTLTGTFREPASYSAVTLTLTGTPTTIVASGSQVSTLSTGKIFETTELVTITALSAWTITTAYLVGARVTNSGNAYECTVAGTSAGSGGPTTTASSITDGTVTWTYLGAGTGAIDVTANATETGTIEAYARDITEIETAVGGWSNVINLLDADIGRDVASDLELRLQREDELGGLGSTPIDALRAKLLQLSDVLSVTIFENVLDVTDADGMPPHSVEALVRGPTVPTTEFDDTIRSTLLANVAAGIQTYGTVSGTAIDSQGTSHTIKFSRPTEVPIYIYISVVTDARTYPSNGDDLVAQAIADWGDTLPSGKDAVATGIAAQAFSIEGVLEVDAIAVSTATISTPTVWAALTAYSIGNVVTNSGRVYKCTVGGTSAASGGPSSTGTAIVDATVTWTYLGATVPISLRYLGTYDTTRIDVVSTAGTP